MGIRRQGRVLDWASAKAWIDAGRGKTSRPLYDRSLSVRLVDPTDPQSDITLNYRWRHTYIGRRDEYAETIDRSQFKTRWDGYRYPILIFKHNGDIVLSDEHKTSPGSRRVMADYASLIEITRRNGKVKIRQASDPLIVPKKKAQRCRGCSGDKYIVYTCWDDKGPTQTDFDALSRASTWSVCSQFSRPSHNTHVVKANCGRCEGTGTSLPKDRWDSMVWEDGIDILVKRINDQATVAA